MNERSVYNTYVSNSIEEALLGKAILHTNFMLRFFKNVELYLSHFLTLFKIHVLNKATFFLFLLLINVRPFTYFY